MSNETEWVLVPRALLEAAVCPMKEYGCDGMQYPVEPNGEGEQCQWCYERTSALSAPQPPAEAQPVAEVRKDLCGCHPETCSCYGYSLWLDGRKMVSGQIDNLQHLAAAINKTPPSAPVGNVLSALAEAVYSIPVPGGDFHKGWRDEEIWEWALRKARDLIRAQQPAPVAPVGVEGWRVEPVEDDPDMLAVETPDGRTWFAKRGDRVFELAEALALAQQPAAVDGVAEAFENYHSADHRDPAVASEWKWWQAGWFAALAAQQGEGQ